MRYIRTITRHDRITAAVDKAWQERVEAHKQSEQERINTLPIRKANRPTWLLGCMKRGIRKISHIRDSFEGRIECTNCGKIVLVKDSYRIKITFNNNIKWRESYCNQCKFKPIIEDSTDNTIVIPIDKEFQAVINNI